MPDLQPVVGGRGAGLEAPITSAVWTCDGDGSAAYQLDARCQDFVTRYLGWSLITPDDPNMREVNRKLLGLAFTVSFIELYCIVCFWFVCSFVQPWTGKM